MAYRVLIVDDSEIIRSVIKNSLMRSGLDIGTCLEAADGEMALEILQREWVDIVFADINMPKLRGDEMIAKLRSDKATESLPIIVISSSRNSALRDEMTRLGVHGYITKPFYPEKLREMVIKALEPQENP